MPAHIPLKAVDELTRMVGPAKAMETISMLERVAGLACEARPGLAEARRAVESGATATIAAATAHPHGGGDGSHAPAACCAACAAGNQCGCEPSKKLLSAMLPGSPGYIGKVLRSINSLCDCNAVPEYLALIYSWVLFELDLQSFTDLLKREAPQVHFAPPAVAITDTTGVLQFPLTPTFPVGPNQSIVLVQEAGQVLPWIAYANKMAPTFDPPANPQFGQVFVRHFIGPTNATDMSQFVEQNGGVGRQQSLEDYRCGDSCSYVPVPGFAGCNWMYVPWRSVYLIAIEVGPTAPVELANLAVQNFKPHAVWAKPPGCRIQEIKALTENCGLCAA